MAPNPDHTRSSPACRTVRRELGAHATVTSPEMTAHLATCEACRVEAQRLNAAWALLNVVESREPSPRFTTGVWAKIETQDSAGRRPLPWSVRWAAAALAVALAAAVPIALWYRSAQDRPELVAQADVMASHELLVNMDVVEDLDVLLLLDDP